MLTTVARCHASKIHKIAPRSLQIPEEDIYIYIVVECLKVLEKLFIAKEHLFRRMYIDINIVYTNFMDKIAIS